MNKKYEFPEHQVRLTDAIRSLAHPARLQIIQELARLRECQHGEALDIPPLAKSTVNHHLLELKKAGFIKGQIMGKKSSYELDWEFLETMEEEIQEFFDVVFSFQKNEAKSRDLSGPSKTGT